MNRMNTISRTSYLPAMILGFFHKYSSKPRLMLEVFVRKNFGRNYISLGAAFRVAIILFLIPHGWNWVMHSKAYREFGPSVWVEYWSWFAFIGAFLTLSFIRWREAKRLANDITYPLNYVGDINPMFFKITLFGKPTEKLITCVFEPIFFFLIGYILLFPLRQPIGLIIMISSIFYSFGNYAEYWFYKRARRTAIDEMQNAKEMKIMHDSIDLRKSPNTNQNNRKQSSPQSIDDDTPTLAL